MGRVEEKTGAGKMLEFAALKRFGLPDEIAEVLAFCADDKPGYLTGPTSWSTEERGRVRTSKG
ncbi:hypothetical protein AB0K14_25850 [Actinosynnema sp. NPDC050801]|uniref:hypothetical protein n=1 Tax=unclassified Actinosynnema TaxID=2637065 RepID=UPI0033FA4BDB